MNTHSLVNGSATLRLDTSGGLPLKEKLPYLSPDLFGTSAPRDEILLSLDWDLVR
jgi:hypothetical protein